MTTVLIICAIMLGATELPERLAQWTMGFVKPAVTGYMNFRRKEARDPEKLSEEIARKTVRKLYNILKVLVVGAAGFIAGRNSL